MRTPDPGHEVETDTSALRATTKRLGRALAAESNAATSAWWTRYLKGEASFRGVPMARVRAVTRDWWVAEGLDARDKDARLDAVLDLFAPRTTEDKLAGIIALAELMIDALDEDDLPRLAEPFERERLTDWNATDWFAVKVLANLVCEARDPARCARAIGRWRTAGSRWQRRASLVAFANLADRGDAAFEGQTELLLSIADHLVRDPWRFSQTAVGWVLRELGVAEPDRVAAFAREHSMRLSREALRNLTQKLDPALRKALRDEHAAR